MQYQKTKLAIIGTVGVPANYGGFETLAHHLVLQLHKDLDITVYNSTHHYTAEERVAEWNGAKIKYVPFKANGIQSIIYDIASIIHAAIFSQVLLILGVSGCIFLPIIKLLTNKKIIVNIDGLEWRRAKWNGLAKRFLIFSERVAVRFADEIITDNAAIQDYVMEKYGIRSRLIEYGSDHCEPVDIQIENFTQYPFLKNQYAFKVCRIEPENNVHKVLEAFEMYSTMPIVIVGNWNHSDYGIQLRKKYAHCENMYLLDPIYEKKELNLLRSNASVYIHGHSAGGTNPSLVEAMHLGLPIIAFDVVYNRVTTENQAIFFQKTDDLNHTLNVLSDLQLTKIAKQLKHIADRRYTWNRIAMKYFQLATDVQAIPTAKQLIEEISTQKSSKSFEALEQY